MVPWGVRGLYEAPAIGHKARPSTMGGEPRSEFLIENRVPGRISENHMSWTKYGFEILKSDAR